jgi:hypothetical protein
MKINWIQLGVMSVAVWIGVNAADLKKVVEPKPFLEIKDKPVLFELGECLYTSKFDETFKISTESTLNQLRFSSHNTDALYQVKNNTLFLDTGINHESTSYLYEFNEPKAEVSFSFYVFNMNSSQFDGFFYSKKADYVDFITAKKQGEDGNVFLKLFQKTVTTKGSSSKKDEFTKIRLDFKSGQVALSVNGKKLEEVKDDRLNVTIDAIGFQLHEGRCQIRDIQIHLPKAK